MKTDTLQDEMICYYSLNKECELQQQQQKRTAKTSTAITKSTATQSIHKKLKRASTKTN